MHRRRFCALLNEKAMGERDKRLLLFFVNHPPFCLLARNFYHLPAQQLSPPRRHENPPRSATHEKATIKSVRAERSSAFYAVFALGSRESLNNSARCIVRWNVNTKGSSVTTVISLCHRNSDLGIVRFEGTECFVHSAGESFLRVLIDFGKYHDCHDLGVLYVIL